MNAMLNYLELLRRKSSTEAEGNCRGEGDTEGKCCSR